MSKQENETIIELKSVSKIYGLGDTESHALDKFDLTVKRGEFIMIMGPSGCGKTTLLNIIGLLDKPDEGQYFLHGKPITKISARKKARFRAEEIGFVFQNFNLISNLSVIENVSLPLIYSGVHKTRRLKAADRVLEHFHLREREYYMPYQLSGGQQQRVAIARSLISNPSIILADEPTGNLDSRSSHIIMEELRSIHAKGNTIIMVTHNPDLTAYATRVINMLDGQIDTDIKTVADHNLPQGNRIPEKISVRVLSKKRPPELEVVSDTPVKVSGENVTVEVPNAKPSTEPKPAPSGNRELHNTTISAKPATAKDAPKPDNAKEEKASDLDKNKERKPRRRTVSLSSLTKKLHKDKKDEAKPEKKESGLSAFTNKLLGKNKKPKEDKKDDKKKATSKSSKAKADTKSKTKGKEA